MAWIEDLLFHYEFTRYLQKIIVGLEWRKAWGYYILTNEAEDPHEAAQAVARKLRQKSS